ncbi:hypothetical protein NA57DRAFT_21610, partial [Rhizodiscina lignyota]
INGIMDLVFVEGVYPELSPGVGYPEICRSRSLLYRSLPEDYGVSHDLNMCVEIVDDLGRIFDDLGKGLGPFIVDQYLPDFVAAAAQVAFADNWDGNSALREREIFKIRIIGMPTRTVLETLTVLNQPNAPEWLRAVLTENLSLVPLRQGGLQETIRFITSLYVDPNENTPIPKEAMDQISKLFATAPQSVSETEFFSRLGPQLLDLLDGKAGPHLATASGVIIGQRILGKKSWGAPGSIGWKLYVEPIHQAMDPQNTAADILTDEGTLRVALQRLAVLVAAHPNPGLFGRLLSPVLLPLWGLCTYSDSRPVDSFWSETTRQLLVGFFKLTSSPSALQTVAKNILFDGRTHWQYGPGSHGGVEIRRRKSTNDPPNIIELVSGVDSRVKMFIDIVKASSVTDKTAFEVLAELTKTWLAGSQSSKKSHNSAQLGTDTDPAHSLASVKLLEAMLTSFKEQITRQPQAVLFLVKQLLEDQLNAIKADAQRKQNLKKPTVSSLGQIVQRPESTNDGPTAEGEHETISIALSLIDVTLSADNGIELSNDIQSTLNAIIDSLQRLKNSPIPPAMQSSITATISLIQPYLSFSQQNPQTSQTASPTTPHLQQDRALLSEIRADLTSPVPPIRAEALANLSTLISTHSLAIDVPSTTLLVLHAITADTEEFVYLKAIRTLTVLTANADPRLVSRFVIEAFVDAEEKEELDARLRVGEGIVQIVGGLEEIRESPEMADTIRRIGRAVLGVAGRRGERPKQARQQKLEAKRQAQSQSVSLGNIVSIHDEDEKKSREEEAIAKIVGGWSNTGNEEDVRIRTSALSIVGKIVSSPRGLAALGDEMLREAVHLALAMLALEFAPEKAILRRAAVLVFLEVLRALDAGLEDVGSHLGRGKMGDGRGSIELDAQKWAEVERVLSWVKDVDEDEIVRGHAEAVLESLEAWRMKNLLAVGRSSRDEGGLGVSIGGEGAHLGVEAGLRGLAVNPESQAGGMRRIEEID